MACAWKSLVLVTLRSLQIGNACLLHRHAQARILCRMDKFAATLELMTPDEITPRPPLRRRHGARRPHGSRRGWGMAAADRGVVPVQAAERAGEGNLARLDSGAGGAGSVSAVD